MDTPSPSSYNISERKQVKTPQFRTFISGLLGPLKVLTKMASAVVDVTDGYLFLNHGYLVNETNVEEVLRKRALGAKNRLTPHTLFTEITHTLLNDPNSPN